MSMSENNSKYKRTNLFLLRVWCDNPDENEHGGKGDISALTWRGIVQRTVNGEAHSFEAKGELIELLEAMICKDLPGHNRPRGNPGSERLEGTRLPANGNNQTEANETSEASEGTQLTTQVSNMDVKHTELWHANSEGEHHVPQTT